MNLQRPDNPLVSIVIPCWGCRDYIGDAIRSALAQTHTPLEILVVEDCGDDGTYEEALKFSDSRLRVVRNEQNQGQYGNKNAALQLAKGDLIKYLDGDDILEPCCVERLVQVMTAGKNVGVVFGRFSFIDKDGRVVAKSRRWGIEGAFSGSQVLDYITRVRRPGSWFGNVTPHLFSRTALEAVGGFPHDNASPGDIETFMKLLSVADVAFAEEPVARYRTLPISMTSRTAGVRDCIDYFGMVERLCEFYLRRGGLPEHLTDPRFLTQWKLWASSHAIMPHALRYLRGRPNQFDAIRQVYVDRQLVAEFDQFVRRHMIPYVIETLSAKIRRLLGLPQHDKVFTRRFKPRPAEFRAS